MFRRQGVKPAPEPAEMRRRQAMPARQGGKINRLVQVRGNVRFNRADDIFGAIRKRAGIVGDERVGEQRVAQAVNPVSLAVAMQIIQSLA